MKKALITGVTGQDGSYLAEFLLKKNYIVHGVKRSSSSLNTARIDHLYKDPHLPNNNFLLHYGDLTDSSRVKEIINEIKPDEIYNLAAQSHVAVSFLMPEYTANVNALGTLRVLEAIRSLNLVKKTRFYQAGTSEIFGNQPFRRLNETSKFLPSSPYGTSKLFSYWITKNYRESYNMHASNGILFNHESPVRGETFVTKKIIKGLVRISKGLENTLYLGNLDASRDWGYAKDYVEPMWRILQKTKPDDLVIATGRVLSVRQFVEKVSEKLQIKLKWQGKALNEVGVNLKNKQKIIKIDQKYYRPNEIDSLVGDARKAMKKLRWKAKTSIDYVIDEMIKYELNILND